MTPIVRNIGKGDSAEGAVLSTLLGLVLESLDVRVRLAIADALTTREDLLARPQVLATLAEVALRESTQAVRTAAVCGLTLSKMPALLAAVAAMPHRWTHRLVVITYLVRRETYRRDSKVWSAFKGTFTRFVGSLPLLFGSYYLVSRRQNKPSE